MAINVGGFYPGNINNFVQQAADQQRFLADVHRARCPQTMSILDRMPQLPVPPVPVDMSTPEGISSGIERSNIIQAYQTQEVTRLMLRACATEAGEGPFPPGFGLHR